MYGAPYKMYGASYILYVAANTCMVRAVLYCTVLRAFSHFHAIYRSFPYNSARNSYFPLHLCAGPVGDSGAQINQPTGAQVQYEHCLGTLCEIHIQMYFLYYVFVQLYTGMVELTEYTIQVYNNCAHHARMKRTIQCWILHVRTVGDIKLIQNTCIIHVFV